MLGLGGFTPGFQIRLFANGSPRYIEFEKRVNKHPNTDEIKNFIFGHLNYCNRCGGCGAHEPENQGQTHYLFDKPVRVCGGLHKRINVYEFDNKSLDMMKKVIRLMCAIINEIK